MTGIITLEGIRKLFEDDKAGQPIPKDAKDLIDQYLELKKRAIKKNLNDWDKSAYAEALLIKTYLFEAEE